MTTHAAPLSALGRLRSRVPAPLMPVLLAVLLLPLAPFFLTLSGYALNILMQAATFAIAVLGLAVVLGYTGQMSLAQAAFFGVGAYAVGLGTVVYGLSFWTALVVGIVASSAFGFVVGLTTIRLGGHYLAMITIACQQMFDFVMLNWVEFSKGPDGIAGIPRPSLFGHLLSDDREYLLVCALVLYAVIFGLWWLPDTRLGRAMKAVRENQLAAEVTGVHTLRVKVIAFTLSAALAGVGGAFYAAGFAYISPDNFNFARSIEFLTMALLGGSDSPFGAGVGTILLILLPEWLRFLKQVYLAAYGLAVILIMIFMPEGIWGLLVAARQRLGKPTPPPEVEVPPLALGIPTSDPAPILRVEDLKMHFGGLKAVDGLDLQVARGTVHALIGPNGSGKTTTLNVLNGIYKPTAGRIFIEGEDVTALPPHDRAARGIGRTFQNIRLFPSLSALENVMVGAQREHNPIRRGDAALRERALSALDFVGLRDHAQITVKNMPYGHRRLVEIARALAGHPKLLFLDEPAAGLNLTEKGELVVLLQRLRQAHGLTIFLIEHDMKLVESVSDRITVINFGKKIAEGTPDEVLHHPEVIAAYLGEPAHAAA